MEFTINIPRQTIEELKIRTEQDEIKDAIETAIKYTLDNY